MCSRPTTTRSSARCAGPCDDPSTVFRVADGIVVDAGHVSFSIVGGVGPAAATISLTRVDGDRSLVATVKSVAAPQTPRLDGRWVAAGRVAQQNVTLKLRDGNRVWGVICGPCDKPAGVALIEDGALDGDAISFFIHHPGRRNFMKGVITGPLLHAGENARPRRNGRRLPPLNRRAGRRRFLRTGCGTARLRTFAASGRFATRPSRTSKGIPPKKASPVRRASSSTRLMEGFRTNPTRSRNGR